MRTTRLVLVGLLLCVVFFYVQAFAASFGAAPTGLGAGSEVISSCGSGMTFGYTTVFYPRVAGYAVSGINVSRIPPGCLGSTLSVAFFGDGNQANGEPVTADLAGTGTTDDIAVDPSTDAIYAGRISGISVVVS